MGSIDAQEQSIGCSLRERAQCGLVESKSKARPQTQIQNRWTLHNIRRAVRIGPAKLGIIRKCLIITESGHYAVPSEYSEAIALMAMYAAFIFQEPQW